MLWLRMKHEVPDARENTGRGARLTSLQRRTFIWEVDVEII